MKSLNLRNRRFGALVGIEPVSHTGGNVLWKFKCDCGNIVTRDTSHIKRSKYPSCGCAKNKAISQANGTHHLSHSRLWNIHRVLIALTMTAVILPVIVDGQLPRNRRTIAVHEV